MSTWVQPQNERMISVGFQGKPLYITATQVYVPILDDEEAEADHSRRPIGPSRTNTKKKKKKVLSSQRIEIQKIGSPEILGVADKFGLEVQNEEG